MNKENPAFNSPGDALSKPISDAIDTLNELLSDELSAVETYDHVIPRFSENPLPILEENRACHQRRIPLLTDLILSLGGAPATGSGAAGVFSSIREAGAAVLGKHFTIDALEAGEDRALTHYRKAINRIDHASVATIKNDLWPSQERILRKMIDLKRANDKVGSSATVSPKPHP